MLDEYEINPSTLVVLPFENNCSKVYEEEEEYIVNKTPKELIDLSCKYFGSSYNGRFEGTKSLLGFNYKAPIIIEETQNLVFFPTSSPRLNNCSWISLKHIKDYDKGKNDSILIFKNGREIAIDMSYNSLENQILRATRLECVLRDRILLKK